MSLNWKEIDFILSEWKVIGAKIQQVLQPTHHELYIELYSPAFDHNTHDHAHAELSKPSHAVQGIYVSLANNMVRTHTLAHRMKKPPKAQRFQQLLQSKLIGRNITAIEHVNQDRIVRFTCEYSKNKWQHMPTDQDTAHRTVYLYLKLWSNQANIIFTDTHNVIFDLAFRRPRQSLMPGNIFEIPKKNTRARPLPDTSTQIRSYDSSKHESFNEYCAHYYAQHVHAHQQEKKTQKIKLALQKQKHSITQKINTLTQQIEDNSKYQELEKIGNIILSHAHTIQHSDTILHSTIEKEDASTDKIVIPLKKELTPAENAGRYFQHAKKAKKSLSQLHETRTLLEKNEKELEHIEASITANIALTAKQLQLLQLKESTPASNNTSVAKGIKLYFHDREYLIMVGRSAKENDVLLRKYVKGNDMWLHIRGHSGAYVFIRAPKNQTIPLTMLEQCAQIAALYSKAKNETYADIYYTQVKYVKKIKNSLGTVTPIRNKNLQIKVDTERTKKYLQQLNNQ